MKKVIVTIGLLIGVVSYSQNKRETTYGIFAGANFSEMSNLPDVLVPQGMYQGYSLSSKGKFGGVGGFYINFKYPYANASIQPEIFYNRQGTELNYNDIKGLDYKVTFAYDYINIGVLFKYYPVEKLYVGVGPYVAFNINNKNITYSSNAASSLADSGVYVISDGAVQGILRESLTGKNYFYATAALGYEINERFSVNFRYSYGLTDALATENNGHRYSENTNKVSSFMLGVGYSFDFRNLIDF
ncbi:MAG: PorT family protein [Flavobacteriaceae bacterium]|jgi:hypothetical protein|nr:PorT family protein [Flavobacteriaceae bacterium]